MGFMNWEETLDHAIEQFGSTPRTDLAEAVARHHEHHPATVERLIDEIAVKHQQGEIRSPWGVLKSRLEQLATSQPKAKAGTDRDRARTRAEQWMRAAGLHYPTWTEAHDDLFGDRGQLHQHPDLEQHFRDLYDTLRPAGERVDAEAIERAETWKQQRAQAAQRPPTDGPVTIEPTCSKCGGTTGKHDPKCPRLARFTTPKKAAA